MFACAGVAASPPTIADAPIPDATTAEHWDQLVNAFETTYARVYAKAAGSPELGFSVTGAIMRGLVTTVKPQIPEEPLNGSTSLAAASRGTRPFYRHGTWHDAAIWHMEALAPGSEIVGPAIIESDATTFVVPEGYTTCLDGHRLFHLSRAQ